VHHVLFLPLIYDEHKLTMSVSMSIGVHLSKLSLCIWVL